MIRRPLSTSSTTIATGLSREKARANLEGPTRRAMLLATAGAALSAFAKIGNIELGVCENAPNFAKSIQYGFDYHEPSAAAVAALTDTAFASFRDEVLASRIRCKRMNILFRAQKVVGPDVNLDPVMQYLDTTFDRCRTIGTEVVVWGSSGSRRVPDGYSRDVAWDQIKAFLSRAGEVAKAKGLVIGIEPLRRQESNIINTGAEALKLVHEVNHPQIKMIVDYFHMRTENEDPEIVRTAKEHIVHLHFANPAGRRWPKSMDEDPVYYAKFFEIVKAVGYKGGLSIEGTGTYEADADAGMAFLKKGLA